MPQTSDPQSTRDKILDVAEAGFSRRGFAGVGLQELASAAGLGKSSLFHHFSGKVELYVAVLDRVLERIERQLLPALSREVAPGETLDRVVDALIDALVEHPTAPRLLLRALFEDDEFPDDQAPLVQAVDHRLRSLVNGFHTVVERGVAEGVFRPASVPDTIQTLIGATVYHFASGDFGRDLFGEPLLSGAAVARRKREVKQLLHQGLRARPNPMP
jgi:AcrR family transcriptional regulator